MDNYLSGNDQTSVFWPDIPLAHRLVVLRLTIAHIVTTDHAWLIYKACKFDPLRAALACCYLDRGYDIREILFLMIGNSEEFNQVKEMLEQLNAPSGKG